MELVSSHDRFFIDARFIHSTIVAGSVVVNKVEEVLYTSSIENLTGDDSDFVTYSKDVTQTNWQKVINLKNKSFVKRSLAQKSISKFSNLLFRIVSVKSEDSSIKMSSLIQYVDYSKLDLVPMKEGEKSREL